MTSESDETNDELTKAFGNTYLREDSDGEMQKISRTTKNELAYEHGYESFLRDETASEELTFTGESGVEIVIQTTQHANVYALRVGDGRVVRNPPTETEAIINGVYEAAVAGETHVLRALYEQLCDEHINHERAAELQQQYAVIPPASVDIRPRGWIIEGKFLLTWYNSLYLVTRDFNDQPYHLSSQTPEADKQVEFIGLEPEDDVSEFTHEGLDKAVSEELMLFFYKAHWLVTHREKYPDDVFWHIINQYIQDNLEETCV